MKQILVILDGAAEGHGSLNVAETVHCAGMPCLADMMRRGKVTSECFCPADRLPDSLICILTMLGVKSDMLPEGRAYLEALAEGIPVGESECVLRCNVVSVEENMLTSFNGAGLDAASMDRIAREAAPPPGMRLYHVGEYRNLLVSSIAESFRSIEKLPPHEHLGQPWTEMTEALSAATALQQFAKVVRLQAKNTSYMLYPWGVSEVCSLPSFESLRGTKGTCICATPVVAGMAAAMGMEVKVPEGATGDTDTDLEAKAQAAVAAHCQHDWVVVHVNGTDEAAHRHDLGGKIDFLSRIDRELLQPVLDGALDGACITVTSDHRTGSRSGKHEVGDVEVVRYVK